MKTISTSSWYVDAGSPVGSGATGSQPDSTIDPGGKCRTVPAPIYRITVVARTTKAINYNPFGWKRIFLIRRDVSPEISPETLGAIERQMENNGAGGTSNQVDAAGHVGNELAEAVRRGLLLPS